MACHPAKYDGRPFLAVICLPAEKKVSASYALTLLFAGKLPDFILYVNLEAG
jgi:hypothetical protein